MHAMTPLTNHEDPSSLPAYDDPMSLVIHPIGKVASLCRASNGSSKLYSSISVQSINHAGANFQKNSSSEFADANVTSNVTVYNINSSKIRDGGGVIKAVEKERDEGRYINRRIEKFYEELYDGLNEISQGKKPSDEGADVPKQENFDDGSVPSRYGRDVRPGRLVIIAA